MGRKKGSKNKKTIIQDVIDNVTVPKRGRPKGSKNKPKNLEEVARDKLRSEANTLTPSNATSSPIIKRGRGRPRKTPVVDELVIPKKANTLLIAIFGNAREIKSEIRRLRKIKLQCRAGSKERIDLHRKIKELKQQLANVKDNPVNREENLVLEHKQAEKTPLLTEEEQKIKHPDDNGCMYFNICKKIKDDKATNKTCYNPRYYIDKLDRKCSQLNIGE
jgi:hypothetical protein